MLEFLVREIAGSFPDAAESARVTIRLIAAALLGAVVGIERERTGKAAGLRTHMLVSLSSALFVLAPLEAGMSQADVSASSRALRPASVFSARVRSSSSTLSARSGVSRQPRASG